MRYIAYTLVAVAVVDWCGFCAWVLSGQTPPDGAYIGTLTAHTLALFF